MQHPFPYEVIYSDRKSLAIQITAQATVRVRVPKNCPAPIHFFTKSKPGS